MNKNDFDRMLAELAKQPQPTWLRWYMLVQHGAVLIIGMGALVWAIKQLASLFN